MTDVGEMALLASRLDNLETRIAYQDDIIETLNKALIDQWGKLDQAIVRIKVLEARIQEVQLSEVRDLSEETPPPHY